MTELPVGLYDRLVDSLLRRQIDALPAERLAATLEAVEAAELPDRVGEGRPHGTSRVAVAISTPPDRLAVASSGD